MKSYLLTCDSKMFISLGGLTIRNLLDIRIHWEEYLKYVFCPPINKLTIERMMSKRLEFHIDEEEDFVGVGSHITLTDGNVLPVSGSLQPDERRMLENTFKMIQGTYQNNVSPKKLPGKLNKIMVLSNNCTE